LGFGFVVLIVAYLNGLKYRSTVLNLARALVFVSFPAQLALEKINIDVVLFTSICLIALLRKWTPRGKRSRAIAMILASHIAAIATAVKIYPGIRIIA